MSLRDELGDALVYGPPPPPEVTFDLERSDWSPPLDWIVFQWEREKKTGESLDLREMYRTVFPDLDDRLPLAVRVCVELRPKACTWRARAESIHPWEVELHVGDSMAAYVVKHLGGAAAVARHEAERLEAKVGEAERFLERSGWRLNEDGKLLERSRGGPSFVKEAIRRLYKFLIQHGAPPAGNTKVLRGEILELLGRYFELDDSIVKQAVDAEVAFDRRQKRRQERPPRP